MAQELHQGDRVKLSLRSRVGAAIESDGLFLQTDASGKNVMALLPESTSAALEMDKLDVSHSGGAKGKAVLVS